MPPTPNNARKFTILVVLISTTQLFSQVVTFNTSGLTQSGSIEPTFNATQQASGVAGVPSLSRTGLTFNTGASGSFFSNGANTTNTLNLANQFVGFQVQPSTGSVLFATSISWASQGNSIAPNNYATAYSTDGFATAIHTTHLGQTSVSAIARTFNITDLITNSQMHVRLYNYGATGISNGGASQSGGAFRVISPTITGETVDAATGNIALAAATEIRNSTALTLGGVISGGFSIEKTSTGVLTLSAANNYSGTTTVTAGTLNVTGSTLAGSAVTVNGGSLTGSGTVGGTVTVASGGTIQAGNGTLSGTSTIGQLTVNNAVTVQTNGTLRAELGSGTVTGTADRLNLSGGSGALSLASGSNLNLSGNGFNPVGTPTGYTLANLNAIGGLVFAGQTVTPDSTLGVFTSTGGSGGAFVVDSAYSSGGANTLNVTLTGISLNNGDILRLQRSGNNLTLTFTPVPEPGPMLLSGGLLAGAVAGVRKLRRTGKPADITPAA